ncbi:SixA phosphatase family protein [Streptomyces antimicrobicus]|uniref:Histidine phosphatase family protein n=1 Tax=Streptomyces antimicrobicus TaxID=2883108 RepID=A0ABS8B3L0_9ACTN|nr:histidine phosphatase family protein [Streptomyces antimicrobicus]MCB5179197.1 histidine phosphatase family protein [Streptomyces antimicrobicus]
MPVAPSSSAPSGPGGRRLVLVRHAKAVPKDARPEDFDRPLSDRGRSDAPRTGRWLARSGLAPALALCSPALRTRETWQLMVPALPEPPPAVYDDRLYKAPPNTLVTVLAERGGPLGCVVLVGHNPGLHELASALCGSGPSKLLKRLRAGFPTSGVAVVDVPGGWDGLMPGAGELAAFWSPSS